MLDAKRKHQQYVSIHYLRGIASLLVVLFHFRYYLNHVYAQRDLGYLLLNSASFGVDLFFIISGFVIYASTKRKDDCNPLVFLVRRLFRIYPSFLIVMAIFFFIKSSNAYEFLRAMIPLHKDYTARAPYYDFNLYGPAWTLTYELAFYGIFIGMATLSHRFRGLNTVIFFIVMSIIIPCALGVAHISAKVKLIPEADTSLEFIANFFTNTMFLEFCFGILVAIIAPKIKYNKITKATSLLLFGVFLVLFISGYNAGFGPQGFGLWSACLFVSALLYEKSGKIKEITALRFLGDISYSLYLFHYIFAHYVPDWIRYNTKGFSEMTALLVLSLIVGWVAHVTIEKPFMRYGKALAGRIKQKSSSSEVRSASLER